MISAGEHGEVFLALLEVEAESHPASSSHLPHLEHINSLIRDAARTLLIFHVFWQEIAYKCKQRGLLSELKSHFNKEIKFLT
jgi:hypothetical protein